jgi:hypothetical protein
VVAACLIGLYAAGGVLTLSVAAVVPGLVGVAIGGRVRGTLPASYRSVGTLLLLAVIAVRLTTTGLAGL